VKGWASLAECVDGFAPLAALAPPQRAALKARLCEAELAPGGQARRPPPLPTVAPTHVPTVHSQARRPRPLPPTPIAPAPHPPPRHPAAPPRRCACASGAQVWAPGASGAEARTVAIVLRGELHEWKRAPSARPPPARLHRPPRSRAPLPRALTQGLGAGSRRATGRVIMRRARLRRRRRRRLSWCTCTARGAWLARTRSGGPRRRGHGSPRARTGAARCCCGARTLSLSAPRRSFLWPRPWSCCRALRRAPARGGGAGGAAGG